MPSATTWGIRPSFKFDVLCLLNTLTGDPFYLTYNQAEYDKLAPQLTPEARQALADLKRVIKDEGKEIISAGLCYVFSTTDDETLGDLIGTIEGRRPQPAMPGPDSSFDDFMPLVDAARPYLLTIFRYLQESDFEGYWRREILPQIEERITTLRDELAGYDVAGEVAYFLGAPAPSDEITVYVLYYTKPHGIKVTGTRFITANTYRSAIVLSTAAHEMMHPPYNILADEEVREAIFSLEADTLLHERFVNHNPDFGYNTFDGYIEESCVRALDQMIAEQWNIARDPRERWKQEDGGMHVFAPCLYNAMKQEDYNSHNEAFPRFLTRMIAGRLAPGKIEAEYKAFYGDEKEDGGETEDGRRKTEE